MIVFWEGESYPYWHGAPADCSRRDPQRRGRVYVPSYQMFVTPAFTLPDDIGLLLKKKLRLLADKYALAQRTLHDCCIEEAEAAVRAARKHASRRKESAR